MKKQMYPLEIHADIDCISIQQECPCSDDAIISIHPDQVDIVIKWLREAKNELLEAFNGEAIHGKR